MQGMYSNGGEQDSSRFANAILRLLAGICLLLTMQPVQAQQAVTHPVTAFLLDLQRLQRELTDPALFNADSCRRFIDQRTRFLYRDGLHSYAPTSNADLQQLGRSAPLIQRRMFDLRLTLLRRLRQFHQAGQVSKPCLAAIRKALRYSRFIDELIAEWQIALDPASSDPLPLQGNPPYLMVNSEFPSAAIRSGDLLLIRSSSFVSATIARIGDEDGQFSHMAMAYVAPDGEIFIIESIIEEGLTVHPLSLWRQHPPARILLLRYPDSELAARAADYMYQKARSGSGTIPYDFYMQMEDDTALFCSEVVQQAYRKASAGKVNIPTFTTSLEGFTGHPFLRTMGINDATTFSPSDAEIDPQLRVVAEWRALSRTYQTRLQDAILTRVLGWMSEDGYQLTFNGMVQRGGDLYWFTLRPLGVLNKVVPDNMTRGFFQTLLALYSVTNEIEKQLQPLLARAARQSPLGIGYREMLQMIEQLRSRDCQQMRAYQQWHEENPMAMDPREMPPPPVIHRLITIPGEPNRCR